MARRKSRGLTEADREVWALVAKTVTRAAPRAPSAPGRTPPPAAPAPGGERAHPVSAPDVRPQAAAARAVRPEGRARPGWALDSAPDILDGLDPARGLDGRTATRVKRGKRSPQARIDLHGMTADRAHSALAAFIRRSHGQGLRFVLVITGKGGRRRAPEDAHWLPEGRGVLRHAAPRWLREPALARFVTGVYPAHITHGGEGAFYVQLSKNR
ncbi:Smr/MutS family protein [Rhodovulum sp. DZ06]|uniref:Smr/MutS family protein n=1 Tax=Rhodovulum sp. DZ06 TaxID=3425126 RepID=UPI003D33631F